MRFVLSLHACFSEPVEVLNVSIKMVCLCVCVCRLVSGAGDIKLTKDGNVLLHEMVKKKKVLNCERCFMLIKEPNSTLLNYCFGLIFNTYHLHVHSNSNSDFF